MREETTMKRESQKNGNETLSEFYNDLFFFFLIITNSHSSCNTKEDIKRNSSEHHAVKLFICSLICLSSCSLISFRQVITTVGELRLVIC